MKKIIISLVLLAFLCGNSIFASAAPVTDSLDVTVHKVTAKPVIDGKVTEGEWGEAVMYQAPGVGYTFFPDNGTNTSVNAVEATIYMLWDEDGYYVAAVVNDAAHFNQHTDLDIWNGDAFEFDSNFNSEDYSDRNRQCYGLNNDGDIYGGSYKVATGVDWAENGPIEHKEYTATRDSSVVTYELFVPWENFCPDGKSFAKLGNKFRGNVQFHLATDGDYIECQRYVLYDAATETSTYPNFILADAAVAPELPSEQTSESGTTDNPKTFDNILGYALLLAVIPFAAVITYKKSKSSV